MAELPPPSGSRATLLTPRVQSSPKRARAPTTTLMLLPLTRRRRRAPPLKASNSFLFTGLYPLYQREVI